MSPDNIWFRVFELVGLLLGVACFIVAKRRSHLGFRPGLSVTPVEAGHASYKKGGHRYAVAGVSIISTIALIEVIFGFVR